MRRVRFIYHSVSPQTDLISQSHSHSLRKEGHTKIVELDLTTKQKQQHQLMNLKRPDVLRFQRHMESKMSEYEARNTSAMEDDSESESEGSEGPREATFSDVEDEEMQDAANTVEGPAKSVTGKIKSARGRNERVVTPEECRAHLRRLFENEKIMCSLLFGRHGHFSPLTADGLSLASADIFFMDCLLLPPTRFRPVSKLGDTSFEHPQNVMLTNILNTSYRLRDLNNDVKALIEQEATERVEPPAKHRALSALFDSLIQLQVDVNSFIDSSKNPVKPRQGKLPPAGVKQLLEKKEGLFRMNMMVRVVYLPYRAFLFDVIVDVKYALRENESTMPPALSFLQMSTSNRMKLAYLRSLPEN